MPVCLCQLQGPRVHAEEEGVDGAHRVERVGEPPQQRPQPLLPGAGYRSPSAVCGVRHLLHAAPEGGEHAGLVEGLLPHLEGVEGVAQQDAAAAAHPARHELGHGHGSPQ